MTLSRSNPRARQRWVLLFVMVCTGLLAATVALAVHDVGEFELDKDASNNTNYSKVGDLGANINASTTAIPVCQASATNTPNGSVILIEAERMTVNSVANGNFGGNCANKRTYTVATRVGGVAHSKGGVNGYISRITTPTLDGPDWNQVHQQWLADNDTKCEAIGLEECTFVSDQIGPSIFIGGATKDHLPIEGWQHTTGGSPDKGEIINAYAAKVVDENNDQIVYFGMDRWAVDGSTDIGFWFFKSPVVACPDPNAAEGACEGVPDGMFAGTHQEGDILALATFTQGGAATNIRVFTWVETDGNEQEHISGPDADAGDCIQDPPLTGDNLCGTVNNTTIEVPWTYTFKGAAVGGWVPAGGMFEGGINLSALDLDGCFSSFLAETRSSPEITAILKDFALGEFQACDTELTTTPADAVGTALGDADEDDIPDAQLGTGDAGVDVTDSALLNVTGTEDFTGSLNFFLCGPLEASELCEEGGVEIGAASGVNPVTANGAYSSAVANITEVGYYCWRGEFTSGTQGVPNATDASVGECFEVLPVTPDLSTTAGANAEIGSAVSDTADLSGTANQPGDPVINPTTAGDPAAGTITFTLLQDDCETLATGTGDNPQSVTVSGDDEYGPVSFTPDATGTYHWVAEYSGDSPNTNGTTHNTDCSDANETVKVVDAYIVLDPLEATNEVDEQHVITATVYQDPGTGTFEFAPDGTEVTFSLLNNDANATFVNDVDTCTVDDGDGACSITIEAGNPGAVDIHATTTFEVAGVELTRATDGTGNNSVDANKIFVDASIAISPLSDENNIDFEHVFTITVTAYPADADVTFDSITPSIDPQPDVYDASDCDLPHVTGNVATCEVTINHGSEETFTLNATAVLTIEGLEVTRDTDPDTADIGHGPDGTGPATKDYIDGSLTWLKHDQDGALLGGATFEVCQTHVLDTSGTTDESVEIVDENEDPAPICQSVTDNEAPDADADDGEFLLEALSLGTWTIRETAAPPGYAFDDEFTQEVVLTLADPDGAAEFPFVNTRQYKIIIFVCNESLNELEPSDVTLEGFDPTVTSGDVPEPLATAGVTEEDICTIEDGAVYGGLDQGTYEPSITIPQQIPVGP